MREAFGCGNTSDSVPVIRFDQHVASLAVVIQAHLVAKGDHLVSISGEYDAFAISSMCEGLTGLHRRNHDRMHCTNHTKILPRMRMGTSDSNFHFG